MLILRGKPEWENNREGERYFTISMAITVGGSQLVVPFYIGRDLVFMQVMSVR